MRIFTYRQASPLPFASPMPNIDDEDALNILDERLTKDNIQEVEDNYRGRMPSYMAHGSYGIAYDLGDRVLKITSDPTEIKFANRLMKEPLDFVVNVYSVKQIRENPDVWAIELEKIADLDDNSPLYHTYTQVKLYLDIFGDENDLKEAIILWVRQKWKSRGTEGAKKADYLVQAIEKNFAQVYNFFQKCEMYGLNTNELYEFNVGIKQNGSIAVLDLGQLQ